MLQNFSQFLNDMSHFTQNRQLILGIKLCSFLFYLYLVQIGGSFVLSIGLSRKQNEGGVLGMQLFKKCST